MLSRVSINSGDIHGMLKENPLTDDQKRKLLGCGFSGAIVIAPFVALLYDVRLALIVLVLALALTTSAALNAVRDADPRDRQRFQILLALNVVFLASSIAGLLWSLVG